MLAGLEKFHCIFEIFNNIKCSLPPNSSLLIENAVPKKYERDKWKICTQ
jgi:hypothetical protein